MLYAHICICMHTHMCMYMCVYIVINSPQSLQNELFRL